MVRTVVLNSSSERMTTFERALTLSRPAYQATAAIRINAPTVNMSASRNFGVPERTKWSRKCHELGDHGPILGRCHRPHLGNIDALAAKHRRAGAPSSLS